MQCTFITRLNDIKIAGPLYKGVKLCQQVYLANDGKLIQQLLTPKFVEWVGKLEAGYLGMSDAYLYATTARALDKADPIPPLNDFLGTGQIALMGLWLVKDNSVNMDTGLLVQGWPSPARVLASNNVAVRFSNSSAGFETTEFSGDELKEAAHLLTLWLGPKEQLNPSDDADLALFGKLGRFHRLIYFLQAARAQNRLPMKIALYCTCSETLCSTDDKELRHQIAERVARFLGTSMSSAERQHIYQQVKDAYDIRSSVVHGDVLSKKFRKAETIQHYSVVCDEYLRSSIRKILSEPDLVATFCSSKEELNTFFKEMIFQ